MIVLELVAGLEIDLMRLVLAVIHEKAFKTSTIYPTGILYIVLVKDEDNVEAPRK